MSRIRVDKIEKPDGNSVPGMIPAGNLITGKIIADYTTSTFSTSSTSMVDLYTFPIQTGFSPGSIYEFFWHVPCRNDSSSWGGAYIEPMVKFNDQDQWHTLGTTGYDAVMTHDGDNTIHTYNNLIYFDTEKFIDVESITFRFRYCAYNSTLTVNGSHDLNGGSGRSTNHLTNRNSHLQHYFHYILKEYKRG